MISRKNVKDLNLSEEQMQIYNNLERKEKALKESLLRCGIRGEPVNKIIASADLNKVNEKDPDLLDSMVREEWGLFIINKWGKKYNGKS